MQLFRQLVDRIPAGRPLVLILDGLDQMDLRHHPEELSWLPERLPPNVKMILSCRNGQGPWERGLRRCREQGFPQLAMPPLAFGELREVIRTVPLISAKALDAEQIDMLAGNPAAANPLFLLTALEELRGFGSFAHLNDRIAAFPRPEGQEDDPLGRLFGQLVERLSQEFDPATSECLLSLLACARNGLTEEELQELVATDDLAFVLHQLRPYLQRHDGRHLGFRHTALRHAVSNAYLAEEDTRRKWHRLLADYFEAQPPSLARTQELPHHLEQAAEWDRLIRFLTDPEVLASYDGGSPEYKAEMEADIKALWTRIEAVTAHRMTEAYAAYIESPREHGKTALFVGHLLADAGHVREARRLVDSALELSERGPERANALNHRAGLYIRQGQFALALDMYAEAEAILTEAGDNKVLASVLANRAIAYMGLGEHQEALSIWREQENGYRQSGNDVNLAVCLGGQGTALAAMGDLHGALALHQEEEGLCRRAGDKHGLQRSLGNQGIIHAKLANEERAAELMAEQARISAELGDRLQEAIALNNQANILKRDGDLDRAQESFRKAASVFRELGDKSALAQALDNLALNQTGEDGVARALELHAEAEALFRETGDRNGLTICLYNQTHARMRAGHKQEALENAEQAAVLAKEIGNAQVRLWSLQVAYNLTMQWGERDRALAFLSEAVQVARDMGQQQGLGEMLAVLGQMSFQAGDIGEARAHFEEAMTVLPRSDRALMQVMMGLSRIMTPHIKPEVNFNAATSGFRDVLEANPDLAKRIAELDRAAQDLLTQKGDYMGAVEVSEKQEQALREAVPGASFDGLLQHQYFLVTALEMAVESDLEKAVACMEKRQAICLRARDYPTRARVLVEMVQRLVAARQVERALEALDRLEGTHGALGNSRKVAETLRQRCDLLGASEIRDERYGSALARSVEAAKQEGNSDAAGRDLLMLAGWLRSRRDYGKALARYREAETCFQEAENALQAEVARANQRLVFTDMGQSGAPPEPKD
jgi:tetratricopeptide (TPR) repeat protein